MKMKRVQRCGFIAVLGICLVLVGLVGSASATADWSHVSVACVPDDTNTTPDRYDATDSGLIRFQGVAIGNLWFWCNVMSPLDARGENPTWKKMWVTFRDSNDGGLVEVKLIQKQKSNGATAVIAIFTSTNGAGVREEAVALPPAFAFDFATHAYFVQIRLKRSAANGDPEFHIVSLKD